MFVWISRRGDGLPTSQQIYENRLLTLDRLISRHDRIVWQHKGDECTPEAVWWEGKPQCGQPMLWINTCRWLQSRKLIVEGLRPKESTYRDYTHVRVFVATPHAINDFI